MQCWGGWTGVELEVGRGWIGGERGPLCSCVGRRGGYREEEGGAGRSCCAAQGGWARVELEVGRRRIGGEGGGGEGTADVCRFTHVLREWASCLYVVGDVGRGAGGGGRERVQLLCSAGADGRVLGWKCVCVCGGGGGGFDVRGSWRYN